MIILANFLFHPICNVAQKLYPFIMKLMFNNITVRGTFRKSVVFAFKSNFRKINFTELGGCMGGWENSDAIKFILHTVDVRAAAASKYSSEANSIAHNFSRSYIMPRIFNNI